MALKNHGGGFVHHNVLWEIMSPNGPREPVGELKEKSKIWVILLNSNKILLI